MARENDCLWKVFNKYDMNLDEFKYKTWRFNSALNFMFNFDLYDFDKENFNVSKMYDVIENRLFNTDGFYPMRSLKTKYIANGIPMGTILSKVRRNSQIPGALQNKIEFRLKKIKKLNNQDIITINGESEKLNNSNELKLSHNFEKNKIEIIKYIKNFPNDLSEISNIFNLSLPKLRAYKAHITMGTYNHLL